jgi:hypothetical protein
MGANSVSIQGKCLGMFEILGAFRLETTCLTRVFLILLLWQPPFSPGLQVEPLAGTPRGTREMVLPPKVAPKGYVIVDLLKDMVQDQDKEKEPWPRIIHPS